MEELENEIRSLDDKALAELRAWFTEYDHSRWDAQIQRDSASGKLDGIVAEALAEHGAGKTARL